jgi:hypothetical protein
MSQFIKAQHLFRTTVVKDRFGKVIEEKPLIKTFNFLVWKNLLPVTHNGQIYPKGGWLELGGSSIVAAPKKDKGVVPPEFTGQIKAPAPTPDDIIEKVEAAFKAGTQATLKPATDLIPYIKAKGLDINTEQSKTKLIDAITSAIL